MDTEIEENEDQLRDDHDEESESEQQPEDTGGQGEDQAASAAPPRKTRKERQEERKRSIAERARSEAEERYQSQLVELQRQNAQLLERLAEGQQKTGEAIERMSKPQEKSFRDKVRDRLKKAAAGIRDDDASSAEAFLDTQIEVMEEAATEHARRIVSEEMAKFQKTQPRAPSAEEAAIYAAAPWLNDKRRPHLDQAFRTEIIRMRDVEKRNLNDDRVWDRSWKEAVLKVAKDWNLPTSLHRADEEEDGRKRVSGTGSRTFGGGGDGDLPELTPLARQLMDRHPTISQLAPEKREMAMRKLMAKNIRA